MFACYDCVEYILYGHHLVTMIRLIYIDSYWISFTLALALTLTFISFTLE